MWGLALHWCSVPLVRLTDRFTSAAGVYVAYAILSWCYFGVSIAGYHAYGEPPSQSARSSASVSDKFPSDLVLTAGRLLCRQCCPKQHLVFHQQPGLDGGICAVCCELLLPIQHLYLKVNQ